MMYFSSILRQHTNPSKATTIMDTILENLNNLRNEFSEAVIDEQEVCCPDNGFESEKNKLDHLNSIESIEELQRHYHVLARSSSNKNSKKATTTTTPYLLGGQKTTKLDFENNSSFYTDDDRDDLDNGTAQQQYEYSTNNHNWLTSKFFQQHRESLDSGHSSPDDSRSPSPTSYSHILKSPQSPTPGSSDDGIDLALDIDEDSGIQNQKSSQEKDNWQLVASKSVARSATKTAIQAQPFCDQRALCSKGQKCKSKHTQKEKELFEARKTAKTANDKEFSDTKFRTELCNKVNVPHNRKMCRFAHGNEQLVCKSCYEVGHGKTSCPKSTVVEPKENMSPVRTQ